MSSPAYSFTSDTNTGVYRSAASTLSIAAQGFESLNITTAGLVVGANKSGNTSSIIFNTSSNSTYITNRTSGVDYQAIGIEAFGRSIQLGVTPLSSTCNVSIPYGKLTVSGVVENTNYVLSPQLYDAGTKTGNFTLDFANGPCQQVTINAAGPLVITLSNPVTGGAYLLKVVQGATPGTVTWPVAVKWGAAGAPVLSTVTGKIDIINLYYDGTNYYGTYALGF
ncbi:hypothetical protein EBZ38_17515 [bacterium]|nr:hypothetical protein [bacterium]